MTSDIDGHCCFLFLFLFAVFFLVVYKTMSTEPQKH